MGFWHRTDSAHWATARHLRKAGLCGDEGFIIGAAYGRLLRHNGPEHILVVASTQSGKTSCVVLPNLLTWRQSVLVHDPKEELHAATAGWRSKFSRVVHLMPTTMTSDHWNPLDGIRLHTDQETRDATLIAEMLTDPAGRGGDSSSDTSQHFKDMAGEAVGGLLLYGLYTQRARSLAALNALLISQPFSKLLRAMQRYPHDAIRRAGMVLEQTNGSNERSGIWSTLSRTLRLYTDPVVARMTDASDFTLRDLRERARPISLYLTIPFGDQERVRGWTRLVMRQFLDYSVSRLTGWTWKLLALIDEVPSLKRLTLVHDGLNYCAGYGVRLALITPSMRELEQTYGRDHHFLEGAKIQILFGMHDHAVAEQFSHRVGQTEVKRTRQVGRAQTTERVKEPLLSPTALMGLPEDQALVIVGRHKVLASKTFYKDNPVWLARSQQGGGTHV